MFSQILSEDSRLSQIYSVKFINVLSYEDESVKCVDYKTIYYVFSFRSGCVCFLSCWLTNTISNGYYYATTIKICHPLSFLPHRSPKNKSFHKKEYISKNAHVNSIKSSHPAHHSRKTFQKHVSGTPLLLHLLRRPSC